MAGEGGGRDPFCVPKLELELGVVQTRVAPLDIRGAPDTLEGVEVEVGM